MALRNGQGQRKKYLTLELSSPSNFVENMCAIVSEFQSAKIGVEWTSPDCDYWAMRCTSCRWLAQQLPTVSDD